MRTGIGDIPANSFGRFALPAAIMFAVLAVLWLPAQAFALDANGNPVLVALGDSYSSGEGIEPFYDQNLPRAQKLKSEAWIAHRSVLSWPGRLEVPDSRGVKHRMTVIDTSDVENPTTVLASYKNDAGFHFAASSGATTENLDKSQRKAYLYTKKDQELGGDLIANPELPKMDGGEISGDETSLEVSGIDYYDLRDAYDVEECSVPRQLDVFDDLDADTIDYVTLTFGGNDVDFVGIVGKAAMTVSSLGPRELSDKLDEAWKTFFDDGARDNIKKAYASIYDEVKPHKGSASNAKILVMGYPALIDWEGSRNNGGNMPFDATEAHMINSAVHDFNGELRAIVDECRADGMRNIYFVDVEAAFFGHEAYSDDPYLNGIFLNLGVTHAKNQEVATGLAAVISSHSIHPNQKGAQAYADCAQAFIDQIESSKADGSDFDAYYDARSYSAADTAERQVALALDVSGSMDGEPLEQTKTAALRFVDSASDSESPTSISLVSYSADATLEYDSSFETSSVTFPKSSAGTFPENAAISDGGALTDEQLSATHDERLTQFYGTSYALKRNIRRLNSGGGTNIEAGLRLSLQQVMKGEPDKRIIVLMSDGEATDGKTDEDLVEYAQSIKDKGVLIYALGFYQSTSDGATTLERIASDGCYYQIDDASQLRYFFGDIADAMNGTKFMYVRIACPVDVKVSASTGTLDSSIENLNTRTDFGSLTFAYPDGESEDPVKVLRLKEGQSYDVEIAGTGIGAMDYTIGFVDERGAYSDMRSFENVPISPKTRAAAVAETGDVSVLRVDNDGDGSFDDIYQATTNSAAQKVDNIWIVQGVTAGACLLVVLIALLYGLYCKKAWRVGAKRAI